MQCQYCGKECKNDNSLRNHERLCKNNPSRQISNLSNLTLAFNKKVCEYCNNSFNISNLSRHKLSCVLNPTNIKECPVCSKTFSSKHTTCSHACSNSHFAHLRNKPDKYKSYTTICFKHHEKKCVVCGEEKIVAVHHLNEDHDDNRPENLIPLCPTHHQYVHSRYKDEVQPFIDEHIKKFNKKQSL